MGEHERVGPSRAVEGAIGPAVEHPPARLTPAAAFMRAWGRRTHGLWIATAGAAVEAAMAEMRMAGWRIEPPGSLRGGV